jgi:hypothetical protein
VGEVDLTKTKEVSGLLKAPGISVCKVSSCLSSEPYLVVEKGISIPEVLGLPFVVGLERVGSPMEEVVLLKLEEVSGLLKEPRLSVCKVSSLSCPLSRTFGGERTSCSGVLGLPSVSGLEDVFSQDEVSRGLREGVFSEVEGIETLLKGSGPMDDISELNPLEHFVSKVLEESLTTFIPSFKEVLSRTPLQIFSKGEPSSSSLSNLNMLIRMRELELGGRKRSFREQKGVVFGGLEKEFSPVKMRSARKLVKEAGTIEVSLCRVWKVQGNLEHINP